MTQLTVMQHLMYFDFTVLGGTYKCIKEYTNSLLIHLSKPLKGIKVHDIALYLYNV